MQRLLVLTYGIVAYLMFLGTFLYTIGFVTNSRFPNRSIAAPPATGSRHSSSTAYSLGLFALQHSVMARPAFKRRWTRIVSEAAERSTFVLFTNLLLLLLFWQWRPLPHPVWDLPSPPLRTLIWGISGADGWSF